MAFNAIWMNVVLGGVAKLSRKKRLMGEHRKMESEGSRLPLVAISSSMVMLDILCISSSMISMK